MKGNYKDGKEDGVWEYFKESSGRKDTQYFINGEQVTRKKYLKKQICPTVRTKKWEQK